MVVEIKPGHRPVGLRRERLFDDLGGLTVRPEGDHAIAFGVAHLIGKDGGAFGPRRGLPQQGGQVIAVYQVVAECQGTGFAVDPIPADPEGLRDPIRVRLFGKGEANPESAAVAQQAAELRQILRRGDDHNVADAGQHQGRQRIVNHWLVVDRQQLLRRRHGHRVQPCAGAAGQENALHRIRTSN